MESSLLLGAFVVGCAGYVCGLEMLQARAGASTLINRIALPYRVAAILVPVTVFLATLPQRPPFASGHALGVGFVVGAGGAILAAWALLRAADSHTDMPLFSALVGATPLFAAVSAVAVPLIWMHSDVIDGLMSVAIGWFAISLILLYALQDTANCPNVKLVVHSLVSGCAFAATVAAVAALGIYHGAEALTGAKWITITMTLAIALPLLLLICSVPAQLFRRVGIRTPIALLVGGAARRVAGTDDAALSAARGWRFILALAATGVVGRLLVLHVVTQPRILYALGVGAAAGLICWWVAEEHADIARAVYSVPLMLFVALGATVVAYSLLSGYGIGLMVLGMWLVVLFAQMFGLERAIATPGADGDYHLGPSVTSVLPVLLMVLPLLLYRLMAVRFVDELHDEVNTSYYAIMGLVIGVLLPTLLAAIQGHRMRTAPSRPLRQIVRLAIAGILALAFPVLAIMLWKSRVALALVAGLAVSGVAISARSDGPPESSKQLIGPALLTGLFALGVGLAVAQWFDHALALATLSRADKVVLLKWIAAGTVVSLIGLEYGARGRKERVSAGANVSDSAGGA